MKIRKGFVSNSSSSSYLIYGFFLRDFPGLENAIDNISEGEDFPLTEESSYEDYISVINGDTIIGKVLIYLGLGETEELTNLDNLISYGREVQRTIKEAFDVEIPLEAFKLILATSWG